MVKHKRLPGGGDYYNSPVGGDGKVYLPSQRGHLAVVTAAGEWELRHQARFEEGGVAAVWRTESSNILLGKQQSFGGRRQRQHHLPNDSPAPQGGSWHVYIGAVGG